MIDLKDLFESMIFLLIVTVPPSIWKIVDIAIWLSKSIKIQLN